MYFKELCKVCLTPQEFHVAPSEVMQLRDNLPPIEKQPQAVKHFADIPAAVLDAFSWS